MTLLGRKGCGGMTEPSSAQIEFLILIQILGLERYRTQMTPWLMEDPREPMEDPRGPMEDNDRVIRCQNWILNRNSNPRSRVLQDRNDSMTQEEGP